ncbi:type IV toxin-antitoxin system AbiEi family antitoxin [Hymenobacter sp. GOD-10R]|uniref:type IV toxin-antitoxin system AbiEi family antitoxin n=1 Tax=Hymenobacter sp. GOD-10R TaxID=3093922 RepID=UPI002D79079A|nr:type IV toxin-antitoxin system AbiEi family antitoxin [Hymenobacter sp. GOD-10R]WRQ30173.1 type IV toxin-antitoxin system AbiEi family antitoxin [Hymenobacter sp. GOD-10R]
MSASSFFNPTALFEQVRKRLQAILATNITASPAAAGSPGSDTQVWEIGSVIRFLATVPSVGTADGLALPSWRSSAEGPLLVIYDYVSNELGKQLRARGLCYADAVGNAWVKHPATELMVVIQGCSRPKEDPRVASANLPADHMRLLFQLIVEPSIATYSVLELAAATGITPVAVARALRGLTAQGLWLDDASLAPNKLRDLAAYWLEHYGKTLRNRLNVHRYRWRDSVAQANWHRLSLPADCLWSGEAAAHQLLNKPEVPNCFTLYSRMPRLKLAHYLGLVPHKHGNVELLNTFFPVSASPLFAPNVQRCVHPFLVYADLLENQSAHSQSLAQELHSKHLLNLLAR